MKANVDNDIFDSEILVVDDSPADLRLLTSILKKAGFKVRPASSSSIALRSVETRSPDLILLDIRMPGMDGFEVCRRLKANEKTDTIPVIFLSALADTREKVRALEAGGVDYIMKPFQEKEVLARVITHLKLQRIQKELEQKRNQLEDRVSERTAELEKVNQELLREITSRKKTEERLRESEERFRTIADFAYNWEAWMGPDRKYIYVSPSFERITGYSPDKLLEDYRFLETIVHPDDRKKVSEHLQHPTGELSTQSLDFRIIHRNGSVRWISHSCQSVYDRSGKFRGRRSSNLDVTEQKKVEEQFRQVQKMEAIGTLAGGIAHDFNNILSAVMGYAELALDNVEPGSYLEDSLNEIFSAGKRARDLVKQILTFARQADEEARPLAVYLVAKEVCKFLRASIPTTIEIQEEINSDALIMADPTQIHQVLMNLCTNAAYAMEDQGGVLEVGLTDIEVDSKMTRTTTNLKPDPYLKLWVSDTGTGIPSDIIDSIFDPYFTTKAPGEGTGMGLAMVHGIVNKYGGDITVNSKPGKGTVFSIYLPIIKKSIESRSFQMESLPSGNERIIYIDDEVPIAKMGGRILEHLGYQVTVRTSSVEALELFRSKPEDFDLVITDMTMPNITGDVLAAEMMAIRADIPVILCTGYNKKITDDKVRKLGIKALAYKPLVKAALAETVRTVLDEAKKES